MDDSMAAFLTSDGIMRPFPPSQEANEEPAIHQGTGFQDSCGVVSIAHPVSLTLPRSANVFHLNQAPAIRGPALPHANPATVPLENSTPPKIGNRFSSGAVRQLKAWLSNHIEHPHPSPQDVELLQSRTGLSRRQIINWISNSRRRLRNQKAATPSNLRIMHNADSRASQSIEVPRRRPSRVVFSQLNPLERWESSPPEHEPADVSDIARAVSGSNPLEWDQKAAPTIARSIGHTASSISSGGTSPAQSSGSSFASAWSTTSTMSMRSIYKFQRAIKRRRRRAYGDQAEGSGLASCRSFKKEIFQCTFCPETFNTKHNWQRHEKSLHLSLEQFFCSPDGPTMLSSSGLETECAFCATANPSEEHLVSHNYLACRDKNIEERTFFRKDHLQQHLKLVHNCRFRKQPMDHWKQDCQAIKSRCGFCGIDLQTWSDRADHIGQHFREGKDMEDWQGSWGFEPAVLAMVEHAIEPDRIPHERVSSCGFASHQNPTETPSNAFHLIQIEIERLISERSDIGEKWMPSMAELQYESLSIIFDSEMALGDTVQPADSWLRDLLLISSDDIVAQVRNRPKRDTAQNRSTTLRIPGKRSIFEECELERQLREHVEVAQMLDLAVGNDDLQWEAMNIVRRMEELCSPSSGSFGQLLRHIISQSTAWLGPFRIRAALPPALDSMVVPGIGVGPAVASSTLIDPVLSSPSTLSGSVTPNSGRSCAQQVEAAGTMGPITDASCYKTLTEGLQRFVATTISAHSPNRHIPTDEELQYQARWIWYDDDDPWKQTPADNLDWLEKFKRSVGISGADTFDSQGQASG